MKFLIKKEMHGIKKMWIYKIKNIINNKIYIGQTVKNPLLRIKQHLKDSVIPKYKLHKAIKKYSINNFLISVLCKCHSLEDLNNAEIYFINYYNSINKGYNIRLGGSKGIHSESTKKKISKANKGRKLTEIQYLKMLKNAVHKKGFKHSEKTKQKLSIIKLNYYKNNQNRLKSSILNSGNNNPAAKKIKITFKTGKIEVFSYMKEAVIKYGKENITVEILKYMGKNENKIWIPKKNKFKNSVFAESKLEFL